MGEGISKYRCNICGYVYDPEKGDSTQNIKPGTAFEQLSDSWRCPVCWVDKSEFTKIN